MPLVIYNTYAKKEQEFIPIKEGHVSMYTCGPTVYGRPHIGNYSSFLMADLLRRWLEVSGYAVTHVKNITDVGHLVADSDTGEDKIEKQAREEGLKPLEIAKKYELEYLQDETKLNMLEPAHRPRASETIAEMIAIVETLVEKGYAYETDDGVYFRVVNFEKYGMLSGNTLDKLSAGARVDVKEHKENPADFALWKKCVGENEHHILRWGSPWGEGFPGWHIECSAMSTKYLGETIDIHTGGEDNIFPHHECEIAQSECASGKQFVRYWLHRRRIDMGSEKMSKSLGNVLNLDDIQKMGFSPLDLRYYFLSVHYRTNLKFTEQGLSDAHYARRDILEWMDNKGAGAYAPRVGDGKDFPEMSSKEVESFKEEFIEAMNADLNTPAALAAVHKCIKRANSTVLPNSETYAALASFIDVIRRTFGCFDPENEGIPEEIEELRDARAEARAEKNYEESDRLRDEMLKRGYEVRDQGDDQVVKKL